MGKFVDLTGQRFGTLTVLERAPDKIPGVPRFRCRCDCGRETFSWAQGLKSNKSITCKSCAVMGKAQNLKHGMRNSRVWGLWQSMKQRCQTPGHTSYPKYGARGVRVCARWQDFPAFLADMGEPPTAKHTIDRIDNAKGYEPGNCRWATMERQQNNRTNNRLLTIDGETKTLADWSRISGIKPATIGARLNAYGMGPQEAVFKPVGGTRRKRR